MRLSSRRLRNFLSLSIFFGISLSAVAQDATTGSISGTVTDASGALIKGATVTLINTDRNHVERTLKTGSSGFYTATALPLGTYTVKVEDSGFKTEAVTGLVLHVSDALTVNRKLVPGSESETVTVVAEEARVNLEDATSSGLINNEQMNDLVLISRNYVSLINVQPGVSGGGSTDNLQRGPVAVGGSSSTVNFSVNGGRSTSNNWTIDGADNLDRGANLTLYVYPSADAIAEFKVLRGQYSAQYGRNAAGQIDVVTKSGSNSIHGSAYEYFRNDFLDAAGYYNDFEHIPISKYRYNDYGFSLGGPVRIPKVYNGKDRTFFFVSENWLKEVTYTSGPAIVPTAAERAGNFSNDWYKNTAGQWVQGPVQVCTAFTYTASSQSSTCTAAGTSVANNISPTAAAYLKDIYSVIPLPPEAANAAAGIDPHTLTSTIPNRYNNLDTVVRVDQQINQKFTVFYRYAHDTFPTFQGAGTFISVPIPGLSATVSKYPGTQHLGKGTYAATPTLLFTLGYAYSNGSIDTVPQGQLLASNDPDIKVPLPYASTVNLVPSIGVTGMATIGGGAVYTDHGINHQAFGDVTKTLQKHTLVAGGSYNHYEKQENSASSGNQGSFSFINDTAFSVVTGTGQTQLTGVAEDQGFANFLTGNANGGFSQTSRNPKVDINADIYEAFVQDNWKANPRLTLNIGVRYSYLGQPYDDAGFLSNFDPATYKASAAPTINNQGLICLASPCVQTGSNAGQSTASNPNADIVGPNYINGLIYGTPSAANNNQASPFGNKVGQGQKNNFAPRVGFAFDLFGDGKTALRGGYGWAFDELEVSQYEATAIGSTYAPNPPAAATYSQTNAVLDNPSGGSSTSTPSTTPGHLYEVPTGYKTPYMQQYSVDIQQQFSPTLLVDIGYFGTHGTHLAGAEEINQTVPGAWRGVVDPRLISGSNCTLNGGIAFLNSTCDRALNQIKPYLGYYAIDAMVTAFSSNYNGLQTKITKKFKGKTYIDANYTWSRDLTNAPADYSSFIQNIYNPNGDYGRAPDDRKHILTMDGVFELPWYREQKNLVGHLLGGWEISAIYAINSGLPLTVSASGGSQINYNLPGGVNGLNGSTNGGIANDNAGLGVLGNTNAGLRPNQIANPNNGPYGIKLRSSKLYEQSSTPWFYTGAFTAEDPNSNAPGNAKRGTINGPGFQRADVGVFRSFRIYDRLAFQLRGEAFNVANHTNINSISTSSSSATFGQVTGYRDARILQVAGRFNF